ncbi:hypothetical protein LCGC14_2722710, partial [marine sediment metagenome]
YDAVTFSLKEYAQELATPQLFFMPAIDPYSILNRRLSEDEIEELKKRIEIEKSRIEKLKKSDWYTQPQIPEVTEAPIIAPPTPPNMPAMTKVKPLVR